MFQQDLSGAASIADDVEPLLRSLGMFDQVANASPLDGRTMLRFQKRELAFDWTHMGNSEISVGRLIAVLQGHASLSPPRTGHLGNWHNIVHGRAGSYDYNHITCGRLGIGHALLFDLNQTESETPGKGDWAYMPGSLLRHTKRQILSLRTWDGQAFRLRSRESPLFTPFTLTDVDGQQLPLTAFHRRNCGLLPDFQFRYLSSTFMALQGTICRVLTVLLEDIVRQEKPEPMLRRLFDRVVSLDGRVERAPLALAPGGFRMGERYYAGVGELIEHALLPIRVAASPDEFPSWVRDLPDQMPLIAAPLLILLEAVLNTHYPGIEEPPAYATSPCNPHLHWGGPAMAGYQPQIRGYFYDHTRHLRKLFRTVVRELGDIDPVFYILLPAAVFNLCPHGSSPQDLALVNDLLEKIYSTTRNLTGRPAEMNRSIEATVQQWHTSTKDLLSSYIAMRFSPQQGRINSLPTSAEGELILLPGFTRLTIQQASMTMGAIKRLQWRRS